MCLFRHTALGLFPVSRSVQEGKAKLRNGRSNGILKIPKFLCWLKTDLDAQILHLLKFYILHFTLNLNFTFAQILHLFCGGKKLWRVMWAISA